MSRVSEHIHNLNKKRVLSMFLEADGTISRPELAKKLNISMPAISNITEKLLYEDLIYEAGKDNTARGRKPKLLALNSRANGIIHITMGYNEAFIYMLDFSGKVIDKTTLSFQKEITFDNLMKLLIVSAEEFYKNCCNEAFENLLGITVAFPAPLSLDGTLIRSRFYGWKNIPLPKSIDFAGQTVDVLWENDANLLALGYSQLLRNQNLVAAYLGIGIGIGITMNGKLFKGPGGHAGEIGQTLVSNNYPLELFLKDETLIEFSKRVLSFESKNRVEVLKKLEEMKETQAVKKVFQQAAKKLGEILSVAAISLDTDLVVLDGGLVETCPSLVKMVSDQINHFSSFEKNVLISDQSEGNPFAVGGYRMMIEKHFELQKL